MTCQITFREASGEPLQRLVSERHPNFECELECCSEHSPGPVQDEETILFLLINPTHFDPETGTLLPIAFQEVHNRDLSVLRTSHADREEIRNTIAEIVERGQQAVPPKLRKVEYGAYAKTADIRRDTIEGERCFSVYDTALEAKRSHASIFTTPKVLDSKGLKAMARRRLHAIFSRDLRRIGN